MKRISLNQSDPVMMSECFEQLVHFSVLEKYLDDANIEINSSPLIIDGFILYLRERGFNDVTVQSYLREIRVFIFLFLHGQWLDVSI